VFLGQPNQQNLQDPQSLNPYSYSEDNPITKSDPSGKCGFGDCVLLGFLAESSAPQIIGYALRAYGGIQSLIDGYNLYQSNYGKYAAQFSQSDKHDSWSKLAMDAITFGAGYGLSQAENVALDASNAFLDTVSSITGKSYLPDLLNLPGLSGSSKNKKKVDDSTNIQLQTPSMGGASLGNFNSTSFNTANYNQTNFSSSQYFGGGMVLLSGYSTPRTANPVGSINGQPTYCWGACGINSNNK
jgi:hypothetical protein